MIEVRIRETTQADEAFTYQAKKAAFRRYVEEVYGWDGAYQRGLHGDRFASQDVRIIRCDGKDVGYFSPAEQPDYFVLSQLFILPEHQGRGIGHTLMNRILDEQGSKGRSVRLQVMKNNPRAAVFYERLGFRSIGETETHVQMEKLPGSRPKSET